MPRDYNSSLDCRKETISTQFPNWRQTELSRADSIDTPNAAASTLNGCVLLSISGTLLWHDLAERADLCGPDLHPGFSL